MAELHPFERLRARIERQTGKPFTRKDLGASLGISRPYVTMIELRNAPPGRKVGLRAWDLYHSHWVAMRVKLDEILRDPPASSSAA